MLTCVLFFVLLDGDGQEGPELRRTGTANHWMMFVCSRRTVRSGPSFARTQHIAIRLAAKRSGTQSAVSTRDLQISAQASGITSMHFPSREPAKHFSLDLDREDLTTEHLITEAEPEFVV